MKSKLVDFLEGKWLGHPLHAAVVHVPVGLWTAACILDIVVTVHGTGAVLTRLAFYCVLVGLLGSLLAVPTGVAEWSNIKKEKPAWKLGLYHMILNVIALLIWAVNFGLRIKAFDTPAHITQPILISSISGTVVLFISAYLGSLMAYDHGIAVARVSKKHLRKIAIAGGSAVPEEK